MNTFRNILRLVLMGEKRYYQQELELSRVLKFARPDLTKEQILNIKWKTRQKEILKWMLAHAKNGLESVESVNVRVDKSKIPGAGEGVFCINGAPKGTLICVHPGTIFNGEDVLKAVRAQRGALFERIFIHDIEHCVQIYDGTVFDAGIQSLSEWTSHPFAVGHKCNHPPPGVKPNVMKCAFIWNPEPPVNVLSNWFPDPPSAFDTSVESNLDLFLDFMPPSWKERYILLRERMKTNALERQKQEHLRNTQLDPDDMIRGLAIITTRDILPNEELLINYRFNPKLKRPHWYTPVDEKEDEARWS